MISTVWWGVRPSDMTAFVGTWNKQSAYSIGVSFNYKIYASSKIKFSLSLIHIPSSVFL
jgi:hypothetical protein